MPRWSHDFRCWLDRSSPHVVHEDTFQTHRNQLPSFHIKPSLQLLVTDRRVLSVDAGCSQLCRNSGSDPLEPHPIILFGWRKICIGDRSKWIGCASGWEGYISWIGIWNLMGLPDLSWHVRGKACLLFLHSTITRFSQASMINLLECTEYPFLSSIPLFFVPSSVFIFKWSLPDCLGDIWCICPCCFIESSLIGAKLNQNVGECQLGWQNSWGIKSSSSVVLRQWARLLDEMQN